MSDRGGRRLGFGMGSAVSLLGVGLEYAASEPGMLLAGKIVSLDFILTHWRKLLKFIPYH